MNDHNYTKLQQITAIFESGPLLRSSHWRCSVRKGVLRNLAKFTGKHLCQSLLFNKVAGLSQQLY